MASPQTENGYMKIANEIKDEIMRRDFSKRQLNIIDFILRISYGCRRKDCIIPKLSYFELVGVNKVDIKKELKYLKGCKVIIWNEQNNTFSLNKDYEKWQISPVKKWDKNDFKELLHINLKVSKTLTESENNVSKTLTKNGEKVSKTLTMKLVKYELTHHLIPCLPKAKRVLKDIIKNNIKDSKEIKDNNPFLFHENHFGLLSPLVSEKIMKWTDELSDELVIKAMKIALEKNIRYFSYCEGILKSWHKKGFKTLKDVEHEEQPRQQYIKKQDPLDFLAEYKRKRGIG